MKANLLFICLLLSIFSFAHPGIGIVKNSKSIIYYTDLQHVWKINRDGTKSVAVPNVHTHELYMDAHDNLYGQHSMYSGEATNQWSYYVWRLNADGRLDTIIKPTDGFFIEDFSFVRDKTGNMYWVKQGRREQLIKTAPDGKMETLATGNFKRVQWLHVLNNVLYFVRHDSIFSLGEKGSINAVANNLCPGENGHNSLFGLWSDKQNNLYVANTCLRKIQQITRGGKIKDYYVSRNDWLPSSGLFDDDGNLWLLEFNSKNEVQVRKMNEKERIGKTTAPGIPSHVLLPLAACLGVVLFTVVLKKGK